MYEGFAIEAKCPTLLSFSEKPFGISYVVVDAIENDLVGFSGSEKRHCQMRNQRGPVGVLFGAQAAYPYLQKTAPGSCLLNTASAAGIYGTPGASVYSATKFGVRAITESLDGEWAADGIDVRSLMPSFIDTPLLDHNPNARSNEDIRQRVTGAGLEITPVADVAAAAWAAIHGDKLHTVVGKTAKTLAFGARWLPGRVRKQTRALTRPMGE